MSNTLIVNLFGGPASGKCFRKGTKILMFNGGIKNVEDINIGDKLMGPDSKKRTVLSLSNGISNMTEIKPIKGEPFYVTENHILPLKLNHHGKEKNKKYTISEFRKLSKWRQERLKLFKSKCIEFPETKIPIDPYFIGCWLGDGNNANQGITSIDDEIIKQKLSLYNMGWISIQQDHDGINALAYIVLKKLGKGGLKYHIKWTR